MADDKTTSELTFEERDAAYQAVEAAMHGRQGGLVPDIDNGRNARAWGEADGYWISLHIDPVLDALIALGWGPQAEQTRVLTREQLDPIRREVKAMMHHLNGMLDSLDESVIEDDEVRDQVYANIRDRFREANRIENALALLAQGDVPAQTTEPSPEQEEPGVTWALGWLTENGYESAARALGLEFWGVEYEGDEPPNDSAMPDREAAIRADQRERDAQIAEDATPWSIMGDPAFDQKRVMNTSIATERARIAAAIREGNDQ